MDSTIHEPTVTGPPGPEPGPAARLRAEAARRLGIRLEVLDPDTGCLQALSDGRRRRVLVTGMSPLNDAGAARLAGDKYYAGEILRRAGFRVPAGTRCLREGAFELSTFPEHTGLEPAFRFAERQGFPLVVKPNRGARGRDVAVVSTEAELKEAVRRVWRMDYLALVQECVEGFDLRLDFLDGELLLGYTRQPVVLEGDGSTPLRRLLAGWDRRFYGPAFEERLARDSFWQRRVLDRGLGLDSVLTRGENLALTDAVLNLNRLCVARMLEALPAAWLEHGRVLGRTLYLRHFGLDLKVPGGAGDLSGDPARAAVLEVNASPSLGQTFERGEKEAAIAAEMKVLRAILETGAPVGGATQESGDGP
ncbi:MAG: hypothetical protein KDD47_25810 [Acidobacteria bacterium]|nr:hypothetical protein [Acidobacteriota bacterium]